MNYCDLHSHYLPAVDDGVKTLAEARELLVGLSALGFRKVFATPHIRSVMFENQPSALRDAFAAVAPTLAAEVPNLSLALAAEHFFDDIFLARAQRGDVLGFEDSKVLLIEFAYDRWPLGIEAQIFQLKSRGFTPLLAHPERYTALHESSAPLEKLFDLGVLSLLDTMTLVGKYGRRPQETALRLLDEGLYDAACSYIHKPGDLPDLERGLVALAARVGTAGCDELLCDNPRAIVSGTYG